MDLAITIADWVFFLSIIAAFIVSIIHREKKDLRPIQLYIIVTLLADVFLESVEILPKNSSALLISNVVLNIYSLFEISLISYFLYKIIKGKRYRTIILVFLLIYLLTCLFIWTGKHKALFYVVPQLFGIENLLITISCLFYISEALNSDSIENLQSNSNFIVICGLMFCFSVMTPLSFSYFIWNYAAPDLNKIVQIIEMIFYSLLFVSLIKAFLCQFPERKQL